jgi:hypothetical protein
MDSPIPDSERRAEAADDVREGNDGDVTGHTLRSEMDRAFTHLPPISAAWTRDEALDWTADWVIEHPRWEPYEGELWVALQRRLGLEPVAVVRDHAVGVLDSDAVAVKVEAPEPAAEVAGEVEADRAESGGRGFGSPAGARVLVESHGSEHERASGGGPRCAIYDCWD